MSSTEPSTGPPPAPVSYAELASFTRQLGAMLDANVNVLRALRIAGKYTGSERLIQAAVDIAARLEDGREFHQAILPDPDLFDPFYVEMVRQGEADGLLGKALLSVADYLDRLSSPPSTAEGAPAAVSLPTVTAPAASPVSASVTLTALGVAGIGGGVIWALAALGVLPIAWLGPLAALWAGVCLVGGGRLLRAPALEEPQTVETAATPPVPVPQAPPAPLPPKSAARKTAETEAIVRGALDEQEQEEEEAAFRRTQLKPEPAAAVGKNGTAPDLPLEPLDLGEEPPRFSL